MLTIKKWNYYFKNVNIKGFHLIESLDVETKFVFIDNFSY